MFITCSRNHFVTCSVCLKVHDPEVHKYYSLLCGDFVQNVHWSITLHRGHLRIPHG